jgi:hypothetical protein
MRQILIPVLALWSSLCGGMSLAEGGPVARIGESGEFLELEYQVNGQRFKDSLPLYRANGVRYFSAGVGLDERTAEYPPFSLKLVFTAGGKPFLAPEFRSLFSRQQGDLRSIFPVNMLTDLGCSSNFRPAPITSRRSTRIGRRVSRG